MYRNKSIRGKRTRVRWPAFAVALAIGGLGCGAGEPATGPDVVLVIVDTLRADHLSAYGYPRETSPRIDAWFAEGRRFDRAYATTSYTPSSVISALTGRYPQHHGVRMMLQPIRDDLVTLPEALGDAGYDTAGFVSNVNLQDQWIGLGSEFDHYNDAMSQIERFRTMAERRADATTDAALEWLKKRGDDPDPLFLMVHYIDPHGPYAPPEPKVREFSHDEPRHVDIEQIPEYQRYPELTDGNEYVDLYDEEIAFTDHHMGRLFDAIDARGRETIYILTADHGETLMEHPGYFQHGHQIYEELMHIPLLVRGPGVEPGVVDTPVSLIDIVPTVRELTRTTSRAPVDGVSLLGAIPDRDLFLESSIVSYVLRWRGLLRGTDKWMRINPRPEGMTELQPRYYDLAVDPLEQHPQPWAADHDAAARLLAWIAADPEDAEAIEEANKEFSDRLSEFTEIQEKLETLGYL